MESGAFRRIDFEKELNEQQLAAVQAGDGPLLVLAAAGTGKTRTLVYRVAWLMQQRGIAPEEILLATFTNKAAREMLDRAAELAGGSVGGVWAGTFHHIANRLLRRHAPLLGYNSDFLILDRDDSSRLVKQARKERRLEDFTPKPNVLLGWFGLAANTGMDLIDVVKKRDPDATADLDGVLDIWQDYQQQKKTLKALDFDDLLVEGVRLLSEHSSIRERYQRQFSHILVDEYQDTNAVQAALIDLLAGADGNVMAVGDDFQCIYSWRGANVNHIMSFTERYHNARILKLEINYRSVPEVLDVANACISKNVDQYSKHLKPTRESYRKPRLFITDNGEAQAAALIEHLRKLRRDGYRYSDIAVLYRAHFHALDLERAFTKEHLPYVLLSGVRFYEQAHIKDSVSFLKLMLAPSDRLSFCRVLEMLPRVGERTALKLWQRFGGGFHVKDSASRHLLTESLPRGAREQWAGIARVFEARLEDGDALRGDLLLAGIVKEFYEGHLVRTYDNAEERMNDIDALIDELAKFDSVEAFLNDVALFTSADGDEADARNDSIRLCTVHQAKGLEWPVVMLIWLSEGMFPSQRSLAEMHGADAAAEERRLFYVAVTRAKDELALFTALNRYKRDGGVIPYAPSRFVEEIPEHLLIKSEPRSFGYGVPRYVRRQGGHSRFF